MALFPPLLASAPGAAIETAQPTISDLLQIAELLVGAADGTRVRVTTAGGDQGLEGYAVVNGPRIEFTTKDSTGSPSIAFADADSVLRIYSERDGSHDYEGSYFDVHENEVWLVVENPNSGGSAGDLFTVFQYTEGNSTPSLAEPLKVRGDSIKLPVKGDTGAPASVENGLLEINTTDNYVRIYADGAWRTLVSW